MRSQHTANQRVALALHNKRKVHTAAKTQHSQKKRRSKVSLLTHVCLMKSQVSLCWWFLKSRVQPQSISLLEMQIVKPLPRHTQLEAVEALR